MARVANIDGIGMPPSPHAKGLCPGCGAKMVAKTGRVTPHWAHAVARDWDPWWENETDWHRGWKAAFPEAWREKGHVADDGEIHRADVETPTGLVLEFQHSDLSDGERLSREVFYDELVWVLDGRPFAANFEIYHPLPHPDTEVARDVVWSPAKRSLYGCQGGLFFRVSEFEREYGRPASKAEVRHGYIHSLREIAGDLKEAYAGHHQYDWIRPRRTWLQATTPVFIDFGGDVLMKLEIYDESDLPCVRVISRQRFVAAAMTAPTVRVLDDTLWPSVGAG